MADNPRDVLVPNPVELGRQLTHTRLVGVGPSGGSLKVVCQLYVVFVLLVQVEVARDSHDGVAELLPSVDEAVDGVKVIPRVVGDSDIPGNSKAERHVD